MAARIVNARFVVRVTVVCFWAVMMGWLYTKEVRPHMANPDPPGEDALTYQALVRSAEQGLAPRMTIYWLGRRVGGTVTTYRKAENAFHISTRTRISTDLVGKLFLGPQEDVAGDYEAGRDNVTITAKTVLGPELKLVSLSVLVSAAGSGRLASVDGRVVGDTLHLTVTEPGGARHHKRLPFDPDWALSAGPATPFQAGEPEVGVRWRMGMINPLTGRYETGTANVTGREEIIWNGRSHATYVVKMRWGRMESTAWVAPDGKVLKQRAPLGVLLVREPEEAASLTGGER